MRKQILEKAIMNKVALCIPRSGMSSEIIQDGYVDTLEYLGWKVYHGDPKTKLCCRKWIEEYGIQLIMTHSRYGMRQLPIDVINDRQVAVIVDVLPLNSTNATINGPYEFAHDDEPALVRKIHQVVAHTHLEPHLWSEYMTEWENLSHLPLAGNLVRALPPTCSTMTDVAMVANFGHRQGVMRRLIEPLFKRLDLLGCSYQAFGDNIWQLAGLNYNGPLVGDVSKLAHIYGTAKVCPNVHTERQVGQQTWVNERSFMIPLCGGFMVTDNPLTHKYLGDYCDIASSTTDFMNKVIGLAETESRCWDKIKKGVEHVAHQHTYFNRLIDLFHKLGLLGFAEETETEGNRAAIKHCWELGARISAEERGVKYEQKPIGATG